MKIIFLIDHMNGFGGAQRVIANLSNEFSNNGDDVCILLTGNTTNSVYSLNEDIIVCCFHEYADKNVSRFDKINRIRKNIKSFSPDIVISFLTMVNIMTLIATLGTNIPVIISERNDPDRCTRKEKIFSKIFYRFADCIVVQTQDIKCKVMKICQCDIEIIENPIVEHRFEKICYQLSNKIVAVGRLNKQKNYIFMLKVFRDFLLINPQCILDIYGVGEERNNLIKSAEKLEINNNVNFMGNVSDILSREKEYDLFVMTSDFEGMPNALAEAMSVGLPCISTNCDGGGAEALIDSGVNGILVDKGNREKFVKEINTIYIDNVLRETIGSNAKKINISLSKEKILAKWSRIIEKTISKKNK